MAKGRKSSKHKSSNTGVSRASVLTGPPSGDAESSAIAEGDIGTGGGQVNAQGRTRESIPGAKARGSHQRRSGESSSGDDPSDMVIPPSSDPEASSVPIPAPAAPLTDYKGTSLKLVGRDRAGKVIPHKRSEKTARQVAAFVMAGYTKNDVAIALNIRPGLVEECYGKELRHGKDMVGMNLATHIVNRAKQSDRMAIFLAKSQYNYRDGDSKPTDTGLLNIHIHA